MIQEIVVPKLLHCARCGEDHENMTFKALERPITDSINPATGKNEDWEYWAPCPKNGEPVLMMTRPVKDGD